MPPFVTCQTTRHGKRVYYFRRGAGKRIRLPQLGTPEFEPAYQSARALILGQEPAKPALVGVNSLDWLIRRYREASAYRALKLATRRQRDNIFKHVVTKAGHVPYAAITRKIIVQGREDRAATPSQARNFLDAMRGLYRWALDVELVTIDPTAGVKNPKRPKNEGFKPWTREDIETYEAHWPAGTHERVWLHVLLYTGLRRGDAVLIGKQHVKNGVAMLKTEKTATEVHIEILPELAQTLAIGPTGDLAFIVGKNGTPLTKESFGNYFRRACNAAGLVGLSAHGVRKIGATIAAEAGVTVAQLEARFGWNGGTMAAHYTKSADRKHLSAQASEKIKNANAPHPNGRAPHLKNIH